MRAWAPNDVFSEAHPAHFAATSHITDSGPISNLLKYQYHEHQSLNMKCKETNLRITEFSVVVVPPAP